MRYYLKCIYSEGIYDDEYIVSFNSSGRNWCFVRRKDVIVSNEREGLVRIIIYSEGTQASLVGLLESHSCATRMCIVPSCNVVKQ
mgnify:CR=1 FL=1